MADYDATRYCYRLHDLERVSPCELRAGDLLAHAGPVGSGVFCADPVTWVRSGGIDQFWNDEVYHVEYHTPWGSRSFVNPIRMSVSRVRAEFVRSVA
jgi:hypothetical protein